MEDQDLHSNPNSNSNTLTDRVRQVASQEIARCAPLVDSEGRFPAESIAALRKLGLLGYLAPADHGGLGGTISEYCHIASLIGEHCLSTALIWTMHTQQVAVVSAHGGPGHSEALRDIASNGKLLASVTSEYSTGGDALRSDAFLVQSGATFQLKRAAPVVSYGEQADYFLITMRAGEDRPDTDGRFVLVAADTEHCSVQGDWNAMGMRGTRSVPMNFDLQVDAAQLLEDPLRQALIMTLAPAAHVGWSAAWYGAAAGAFKRLVLHLRSSKPGKLQSDDCLKRLSRLRVELDLIKSFIKDVALRCDDLRNRNAALAEYEDKAFSIAINNVKVAASERAFAVVNQLMDLAGMNEAYMQNRELALERVFRDLRSASLMFSNDRLLDVNGRLNLVTASTLNQTW